MAKPDESQANPGLFQRLAERNGGAPEGAMAEQPAAAGVRTVLRVKRKRCEEAEEVFVLQAEKRPTTLAAQLDAASLQPAQPGRKVFRRVVSGAHAARLAKRCVKGQTVDGSLKDSQTGRRAGEAARRKQARTAQIRSSRYAQCGETVVTEDSMRVIDIEKSEGEGASRAPELLCNGSPMVRELVDSEEADEWVFDFYELDEQAGSSGEVEAEVLTVAYLDENGELVCEDAVDSDDEPLLCDDEDPDAQEWDYPDEDEADDEEQWWGGGDEGGAGLSSDDDDLDIYKRSMYNQREEYHHEAFDDAGSDGGMGDY